MDWVSHLGSRGCLEWRATACEIPACEKVGRNGETELCACSSRGRCGSVICAAVLTTSPWTGLGWIGSTAGTGCEHRQTYHCGPGAKGQPSRRP
jgi:hypothetical protein